MFLSRSVNRALIKNASVPMRGLKLHEYQAGALLSQYNVPTAMGRVAFSADEALKEANEFAAGSEFVVKAQVLTGGRGMGTFANGFKSGVHMVDSPAKV
jgi:succinyl-CoA synthetase beta subunit